MNLGQRLGRALSDHRAADAGLITGERQGRHRYVRLASPAVAEVIAKLRQAEATARREAEGVEEEGVDAEREQIRPATKAEKFSAGKAIPVELV